jgi:hypothetical protein
VRPVGQLLARPRVLLPNLLHRLQQPAWCATSWSAPGIQRHRAGCSLSAGLLGSAPRTDLRQACALHLRRLCPRPRLPRLRLHRPVTLLGRPVGVRAGGQLLSQLADLLCQLLCLQAGGWPGGCLSLYWAPALVTQPGWAPRLWHRCISEGHRYEQLT